MPDPDEIAVDVAVGVLSEDPPVGVPVGLPIAVKSLVGTLLPGPTRVPVGT